MKKMLLLFSHQLTAAQQTEAEKRFQISEFIYLPEPIQAKWSNISPEGELDPGVINLFQNFTDTSTEPGDLVLVQGDYGVSYAMVRHCIRTGRVPVYATTHRLADEKIIDGEKIVQKFFRHQNFRRYPDE